MPITITITDEDCVEACCQEPDVYCVCCCSQGYAEWDPPVEGVNDSRCILPTMLQWTLDIANAVTVINGSDVSTATAAFCVALANCDVADLLSGTWTLRRQDSTYTEVDPLTEIDPCSEYDPELTVPCVIQGCRWRVQYYDYDAAVAAAKSWDEIAQELIESSAPRCSMETVLVDPPEDCLDTFAPDGYVFVEDVEAVLRCQPPFESLPQNGMNVLLTIRTIFAFKDDCYYDPPQYIIRRRAFSLSHSADGLPTSGGSIDWSQIYCNNLDDWTWEQDASLFFFSDDHCDGDPIGPYSGITVWDGLGIANIDDSIITSVRVIVQGADANAAAANITSTISFL